MTNMQPDTYSVTHAGQSKPLFKLALSSDLLKSLEIFQLLWKWLQFLLQLFM